MAFERESGLELELCGVKYAATGYVGNVIFWGVGIRMVDVDAEVGDEV
jgi:hypothetical protein